MEWSFECPGGGMTVRQEGEWAICRAIGRAAEEGLYKAWLKGKGGEMLLGTLIPEGGALQLRRKIPLSALKAKGAWPPEGVRIVMSYPFFSEALSQSGWRMTDCPGRLIKDRELSSSLEGTVWALTRREGESFLFAFPYASNCPFPLPPLFCLCRVEKIGEGRYAVFRFSSQGRPELLTDCSPGEGAAV